jgi:hypothetical protein
LAPVERGEQRRGASLDGRPQRAAAAAAAAAAAETALLHLPQQQPEATRRLGERAERGAVGGGGGGGDATRTEARWQALVQLHAQATEEEARAMALDTAEARSGSIGGASDDDEGGGGDGGDDAPPLPPPPPRARRTPTVLRQLSPAEAADITARYQGMRAAFHAQVRRAYVDELEARKAKMSVGV